MTSSNPVEFFSPTYGIARTRLRSAAEAANWKHVAVPVPGQGVEGEDLNIDVFSSSGSPGGGTLVVSSGTHGVEGYVGSAIQLALLEYHASRRTPKIVLLHALNPFGFSWGRRVTGNNVDLNRNFLEAGQFQRLPVNVGYQRLTHHFRGRTGVGRYVFFIRALLTISRIGFSRAKQAVAGGQYHDPDGLFFGGHRGTPERNLIEAGFAEWIGQANRVVHLDLHSGAGKWGCYTLQTSTDRNQAIFNSLKLDNIPIERLRHDATLYSFSGGLHNFVRNRGEITGDNYVFAYLEIGTYGPLTMISALRNENLSHHRHDSAEAGWRSANARLREMFCPADPSWRRKAIEDGCFIVKRTLDHLARP